MTQTKKVTVYSTDACSHCDTAKHFLKSRGVDYVEINLSRDEAGRNKLVKLTGMYSFPQILIGNEPVGGLAELVQAESSGLLEDLLSRSN